MIKHPTVMRERKSLDVIRRNNNFITAHTAISKKLGELAGQLMLEKMSVQEARYELLREIDLWTGISGAEAVANALGMYGLRHLAK